jgi:hypothetical protein
MAGPKSEGSIASRSAAGQPGSRWCCGCCSTAEMEQRSKDLRDYDANLVATMPPTTG